MESVAVMAHGRSPIRPPGQNLSGANERASALGQEATLVELADHAREPGKDLPCAYDASVCDSNILAVSLGIPVVTFGPSGGNMHGDNEYGYAWQVKNCGEVYRRTVARLLSGEV